MMNYKRERGLTFISIAFILGMIAFFTMLVLKIGPIYMNHSKVVNALTALEKVNEIQFKSKREVSLLLQKRFDINYVESVLIDDVKIKKIGPYLKVEVQYEVVENIFGNLSVLVEFHEMFEVGET